MIVHIGPRSNSAIARAREFFLKNPAECLSHVDMAAKFGISLDYTREVIRMLRAEGVISSALMYFKRTAK